VYLPKHFEEHDRERLKALVVNHPLVHIVQWHEGALSANPVPMLLVESGDGSWRLQGHVARANPMWRVTGTSTPNVLAIVAGPDDYISPSWYATKAETHRVVPTWNYATWHAHGRLRAIEDRDWLLDLLHRLTNTHESRRAEPWSVADAPADYVDTMLKAIVGIEITIERIEAKFKLSQNHPESNRRGVLDGLARHESSSTAAVRDLMMDQEESRADRADRAQ